MYVQQRTKQRIKQLHVLSNVYILTGIYVSCKAWIPIIHGWNYAKRGSMLCATIMDCQQEVSSIPVSIVVKSCVLIQKNELQVTAKNGLREMERYDVCLL